MELTFSIGGALRKVFINGRIISLMTAETGYAPMTIDLDKLNDKDNKKKLKEMGTDDKFLKQLSKLKTEKEIANDIKKDFQADGWRLIKKTK